MAGSQAICTRAGGLVITIAVMFVALGTTSRAQGPGLPIPAPPSDLASMVDATEPATDPVAPQPLVPGPSFGADGGPVATASGTEMGFLGAAIDSLFGDVYAEGRWRPLSLSTFFSEGWNEPWAAAPAGRLGLTPRHGWLASFDAVFYRLWFITFGYQNDINTKFGGNRYTGTYSIFLPFSRRFEVLLDVPFVVSNGTKDPTRGYASEFGDLTVTPRFMLSETAATSQAFALAVRTPTGMPTTGNGIMALTPRYEFWTNPGGPWVVRGSTGIFVPMNKAENPVQTSIVGGVAVGRYFTPHDVPFGDLVFYAASNFTVPLDGGASRFTVVSVGPGTRFHIANDYYFLADWDFPVTGNRPDRYTLQLALLKVF
jgi:hypothetical protein